MKQISEGIAEAIALTLNRYNLSDEDYGQIRDEAAEFFADYVKDHIPATVIFSIETCMFLDAGTLQATKLLTDSETEAILQEAEVETDDFIDDAIEQMKFKRFGPRKLIETRLDGTEHEWDYSEEMYHCLNSDRDVRWFEDTWRPGVLHIVTDNDDLIDEEYKTMNLA